MDSEIDLSLPAFSIIQDSVEIGFKKLKDRFAYIIWIYIRTAQNGEDSYLKFCIYYIKILSYGISVTINMRAYLKLKYGIIIDRIPGAI
jgi:hypothetical protein